MFNKQFLRRKDAGLYLKDRFGFGSEKSLAKLACVGGGPEFRKAGSAVLYEPAKLDEWAVSKVGSPRYSTSEAVAPSSCAQGQQRHPFSGIAVPEVCRDSDNVTVPLYAEEVTALQTAPKNTDNVSVLRAHTPTGEYADAKA